jgi:hypothetical protein
VDVWLTGYGGTFDWASWQFADVSSHGGGDLTNLYCTETNTWLLGAISTLTAGTTHVQATCTIARTGYPSDPDLTAVFQVSNGFHCCTAANVSMRIQVAVSGGDTPVPTAPPVSDLYADSVCGHGVKTTGTGGGSTVWTKCDWPSDSGSVGHNVKGPLWDDYTGSGGGLGATDGLYTFKWGPQMVQQWWAKSVPNADATSGVTGEVGMTVKLNGASTAAADVGLFIQWYSGNVALGTDVEYCSVRMPGTGTSQDCATHPIQAPAGADGYQVRLNCMGTDCASDDGSGHYPGYTDVWARFTYTTSGSPVPGSVTTGTVSGCVPGTQGCSAGGLILPGPAWDPNTGLPVCGVWSHVCSPTKPFLSYNVVPRCTAPSGALDVAGWLAQVWCSIQNIFPVIANAVLFTGNLFVDLIWPAAFSSQVTALVHHVGTLKPWSWVAALSSNVEGALSSPDAGAALPSTFTFMGRTISVPYADVATMLHPYRGWLVPLLYLTAAFWLLDLIFALAAHQKPRQLTFGDIQ